MSYIASALIVLGQSVVGLIYLVVFLVLGFAIAEWLGFIEPALGQKPNERWLKRQAKKEGRKTKVEQFAEALTEPGFLVIDEGGEMWWTMPKEIFDNIAADFGVRECQNGDMVSKPRSLFDRVLRRGMKPAKEERQ